CYLCLLLHSLCSALSYSPRSHRDPHSFPTRRSSDLAAQLERLGRSCDPRIADGVLQVTSFDPDRLADVDHVSEELEKLQAWLETNHPDVLNRLESTRREAADGERQLIVVTDVNGAMKETVIDRGFLESSEV